MASASQCAGKNRVHVFVRRQLGSGSITFSGLCRGTEASSGGTGVTGRMLLLFKHHNPALNVLSPLGPQRFQSDAVFKEFMLCRELTDVG